MAYEMDHTKRGYFLVFGNQEHSGCWADSNRGNEDKVELTSSLTALGFDVKYFHSLTTEEILNNIRHFSSAIDHSDYDCFGCAILTHGGRKGILHSKDGAYRLRDIMDPFKHCKTLEGKPKLFFVQAVIPSDAGECGSSMEQNFEKNSGVIAIPNGADFLVGYCTAEGCISSCKSYIRTLSDSLVRYRYLDLLQVLTKVNEICCVDKGEVKQSSTIVSRLGYPFHFSPKMGFDYAIGEEEEAKILRIFAGSLVGHTITLRGTPTNSHGRFTINFPTDIDQKIYFHFNVRMKERLVVRNSRAPSGKWSWEDRVLLDPFPFAHRVPFKLDIMITEWCFCVTLDGKKLLAFVHRSKDIDAIRKVTVLNNVEIDSLTLA